MTKVKEQAATRAGYAYFSAEAVETIMSCRHDKPIPMRFKDIAAELNIAHDTSAFNADNVSQRYRNEVRKRELCKTDLPRRPSPRKGIELAGREMHAARALVKGGMEVARAAEKTGCSLSGLRGWASLKGLTNRDRHKNPKIVQAHELIKQGVAVAEAAHRLGVNKSALRTWASANGFTNQASPAKPYRPAVAASSAAPKREPKPSAFMPWSEAMTQRLKDLMASGKGSREITRTLRADFPQKAFTYANVDAECKRAGIVCTELVVSGSPPYFPLTSIDWTWALEGWEVWSELDLDRTRALWICRPTRLGEDSYGFYIAHAQAERPVPIHTALWREWVTVAEARAHALTFFSAAKDGLPQHVKLALDAERQKMARANKVRLENNVRNAGRQQAGAGA